ncbi:MAG: 3-deoxy-manno-octulosonate cytidylyltransferase [Alphaproteobacteria bacterium]|jgi:3-deoxy-manno-octulosonate cytidylyltransferase (CMP-KDO synthetase)|nr:3-deoxy-manno-octulosonate cytidylyltransferase [Alphaproteobacteria bacterium]
MKKINPIIVIPTRLAATRLPNKPLRLINNLPMIIHVVNRAIEADIAEILVAAGDQEILDTLKSYNIKGILTDPNLPSGTDRINEALNKYDPQESYNIVINLQGDLPTIDKQSIQACLDILQNSNYDISTIGVKLNETDEDMNNPNVVKAIANFNEEKIAKALDFKRNVNSAEAKNCYHHIGIYGYRRESLKKFTSLKPTEREITNKLEQLRALDNGMSIGFKQCNIVPIGVDTIEDLEKASTYLKSLSK